MEKNHVQDKSAEGENLRRLLSSVNKAQFAREHGLNPSMIGQQMRGERPISLQYAKAYAAALKIPLAEISPFWAAATDFNEIKPDEPLAAASAWPFSPDLLPQVLSLDDRQRLQLEGAIRLMLLELRNAEPCSPSGAPGMAPTVDRVLKAKLTTETKDIIRAKVDKK